MDYSNFGNAPTEQGGMGEVIPDGTLGWAILKVRPFNLDQGLVLTPSKSTEGNAYLDVELTMIDGPYERRKVWDIISLQGGEKGVSMGMAKVRHILEVGREIQGFAQTDSKYRLGAASGAKGDMVLMELDELRCAVKIGVEKGKDGYPDKNKVRAYLSPNPASDTFKTFMRLVAGDTAPTEKPKPAAAANAPAWSTAASKPATTSAAPPQGRPSWAGAAPKAAAKLDDNIPF
jgi:hypothetical protein